MRPGTAMMVIRNHWAIRSPVTATSAAAGARGFLQVDVASRSSLLNRSRQKLHRRYRGLTLGCLLAGLVLLLAALS